MSQPGRQVRAIVAASAATIVAAGLYAAAPEIPKPGPEHAALAREEGTWDASVEIPMGPPGSPPQVSKGVEHDRVCCGGRWLIKEYKSNPDMPPFEGHGITGYDLTKKKYVATWVDSDLETLMTSEGAYDVSGKTLTLRGSMTSKGKTLQWRDAVVWKDDDTRQFIRYMRGPEGKETPGLSITYTRRK